MTQSNLFDKSETGWKYEAIKFNGPDYNPAKDNIRLSNQILRIYNLMKDGKGRTLHEIGRLTGDPQSSISAQLRHLRKERFGSHQVNKRNLGRGLFEYQLIVHK